jgi:hypothetical protein
MPEEKKEVNMFETVKEIIKAGGVVIMGGATFLTVVKVLQVLLVVFGVVAAG